MVTWFGVWAALTLYEVPLVMGAAAIGGSLLLKKGETRALAIPLVLLPYLLIRGMASWFVLLAAAQLLILVGKIGVFYWSQTRKNGAATSG